MGFRRAEHVLSPFRERSPSLVHDRQMIVVTATVPSSGTSNYPLLLPISQSLDRNFRAKRETVGGKHTLALGL